VDLLALLANRVQKRARIPIQDFLDRGVPQHGMELSSHGQKLVRRTPATRALNRIERLPDSVD
jgi:hypothetical protein